MIRAHWLNGLLILSSVAGCGTGAAQEPKALDLSKHEWEQRVILLFTDDLTNPEFVAMKGDLASRTEGVAERHLVLYEVLTTQPRHRKFVEAWGAAPNGFTYILIGKDGGEKMRANSAVDVADIFRTIDAMPMRQSEMRSLRN